MNRLETAKQLAAEMQLNRAAAETLLVDVKLTILDQSADDDDLRALVILQALLRGDPSRYPQDGQEVNAE